MFIFYRLFHRFVQRSTDGPSGSPKEPSTPESPAVLVWFLIFIISLVFRPAAALVIRILFFSACTLLTGTISGSLNLLVGHAVLRAMKYDGYDPPLLSSIEAGSLGGLVVIGPTTLVSVCLIAFVGGPRLSRVLPTHVTFLLELASLVAVSTAACSLGVTIAQSTRMNDPLLDATHAARAGTLGACIFTVPIVSTAAFLMREAQTTRMPSAQNDPINPPPYLADDLVGFPENHVVSNPRTPPRQYFIAHPAAETVGYVLVTLCILTIRLLCF